MLTTLFYLLCEANAVPLQLTHQGRLLDSSGSSVTGVHILSFKIYDDETAGLQLWSENQVVAFNNGYYSVILGTDEQNNALDSNTLSQYPLYLELTLDQNAPMSPRQVINSAPYAQMAGISESVEGGSVNASQIWVNNIPVIDSSGAWVGPALSVTWADVAGKPQGFADNADNDSLGGISCSVGEIPAWTGSNWGCASDNTVDAAGLGTMLSNNAYDLNLSTTVGGDTIVTSLTDQDSLGSLSCSNDGEVAKYDIATSSWYCSGDLAPSTTLDSETIVTIPSSCSDGQFITYDAANNSANCVDLNTMLDQDSDGVLSWNDCDDSDSSVAIIGDAASCSATSCLSILQENSSSTDGLYWINPDSGTAYETYCDMTTDGGGWTQVGTISDNNESINNASHIWGSLNATQHTGIWEDNSTYGGQSFTADFKSEAWSDVNMTQLLLKDQGASQRNLWYSNPNQISSQTLSDWFASLQWGATGSDSSSSAFASNRVSYVTVTNFGIVDPVLESGNKSVILFKFGEADGAQDSNKDRAMIAWHRHNQGDSVDAPVGIGAFTNRSGQLDYRDIFPISDSTDYPLNSISGTPHNYTIWVR